MDLEYDQKFEEMKKYIPFLESMITRLESTSPAANPRQAQLDKIRSLRDLLLNKKKRMKMENLLKCEQVLVNLYAKVEQRDTLSTVNKAPDPGFSIDPPTAQEKSDLEAVRNKLKTVAKRQEEVQDTLPEILRGNEVEEVHTAGSKEPALFQRRPNKSSLSPTRPTSTKTKEDKVSPPSSASKRNYTRVLVSPDTSSRRWSQSETTEEKPLFSRRSPRRSPRRYSPSYHKRERKKSSKESSSRKSRDLNITLNVPEDSLSTLNTKDIFTRIINCRDGDVDIDTLRELRKQILTELQKTGARDDISDLILKSYKKKKDKKKPRRKEEVEEGEISDSESEVIENIYGNLVLKDQYETKTATDNDKARKIQICLVINSDKHKNDSNTNKGGELSDVSELEMFEKENDKKSGEVENRFEKNTVKEDNKITSNSNLQKDTKAEDNSTKSIKIDNTNVEPKKTLKEEENEVATPKDAVQYKANFYQPLTDNSKSRESEKTEEKKVVTQSPIDTLKDSERITSLSPQTKNDSKVISSSKNDCNIESEFQIMEKPTEIPLLNEPTIAQKPSDSTVLEIDILQALKNEILSESITISGSEASTPLLHQPKIMKVASAKEILPKKRISIEKYKQKATEVKVSPKFYLDEHDSLKDDSMKKPSLKLTEKECERFQIPKISFDDESSDDNDGSEILASDLYGDLAPKSPDNVGMSSSASTPPVIIPVDPVKTVPVNHKVDIDMRTLPILSPSKNKAPKFYVCVPAGKEEPLDVPKNDAKADQSLSQNRSILDPRVRRDILNNKPNNLSPSPHTINPDRTPRPVFSNICQSPASNTLMTPNARSYEMTPNHQSFDLDTSNNKHVYVPTFTMFDSRDRESSVAKDTRENIDISEVRKSRLEDVGDASWSSSDVSVSARYSDSFTGDKYNNGQRKSRFRIDNRDMHKGSECTKTPGPSFGRSQLPDPSAQIFGILDKPLTSLHTFGRADCPSTPSHPFGRSECPSTPIHPFGRSECPLTPSHPFGRSDGIPTTNHTFGNNSFNVTECPLTPTHTFGASECPPTPTPYFGRSDCPPTPNHSFGRSDKTTNLLGRSDFNTQKFTKDPRLSRKTDHESHSQFNERERGYFNDRNYYRGSSYKSQKTFNRSDSYQNQDREPIINSKYRYYGQDQGGRKPHKDGPRREPSISGSMSKDYENDRLFTRERGRYNNDTRGHEDYEAKRHQPERSIGRNMLPEDKCERSVGQSIQAENIFSRSSSRAPSIGRSSSIDNNTLSVKPDAGRSFTIDTSVNATFQSFLETGKGIQVFEYNFDARRKRASSVGRSLARDSSVGRILSNDTKRQVGDQNKREIFRRASSMGRELADTTEKKSLQEIKADFKTYTHPEKIVNKFDTGKIRNIDTKSKCTKEDSGRNKKVIHDKHKDETRVQNTSNPVYSPRKNYRDPRMRREIDPRNKYNERHSGDARARKSGIVYSNDNIVKGAILTSGYGVKNYKIPKIKRVIEEKEEQPSKTNESTNIKDEKNKNRRKIFESRKEEIMKGKANDTYKDKMKETSKPKSKEESKEWLKESSKECLKEKEMPTENKREFVIRKNSQSDTETEKSQIHIDDISNSEDQIERRLTRSSRRTLTESKTVTDLAKTKKAKKSVISDSDSDAERSLTDNETQKQDDNNSETTMSKINNSPVKEKKACKRPSTVDVDTSFGLDELEMFSDNVVSDPVLDNINALIADLDNDLDTSKTESSNDFTKEITLENMMQNITSPLEDNSSQSGEEFSKVLNDVDNLSKTSEDKIPLSDLNKVIDNSGFVNTEVSHDSKSSDDQSTIKTNNLQKLDSLFDTLKSPDTAAMPNDVVEEHKNDESLSSNNTCPSSKPTNEDIVSTTETEQNITPVEDTERIGEQHIDGCSTPDSTINTDEVLQSSKIGEVSADSTNEEVHGETNVTSTDSVEPKPSSSRIETTPGVELGNLLTILQDKSKIMELLSLLGDQSGDNDKIKKKLEKLSEIVSDEEIEEKTQSEEIQCETSELTDVKSADVIQNLDEKAESKVEKSLLKDSQETQINVEGLQEKDETTQDFIGEKTAEGDEIGVPEIKKQTKKRMPVKKSKFAKKGKGRYAKKVKTAEKRVTRATAAVVETKQKPKKPPRELQKLHEDIKEMFIRDDILSATGIRMCRLAKMVEEKSPPKEEQTLPDAGPVVVLDKFKNSINKNRDFSHPEKARKKPGPKPKSKISTDDSLSECIKSFKYKPGPKSKTKNKKLSDPYAFETESVGDTNTEKASEDDSDISSDSEVGSLASSKSFGSSEILSDVKKKAKRKRRGWQDGVIKPKNKKKKVETKLESTPESLDCNLPTERQISIPDMNCFTDRNYCFRKNDLHYSCRLCMFFGKDIVHHYKNEHPHVEIPLSRMAPAVAKEAIEQCKEINFQAVSKISSEKYVCIFCYQEFANNNSILETFFWHVVSMHTGEYKHNCSECSNENRCPFSLDIPPPPKDTKGQLIGYICKKCNFTQLSLENLKTHVIVRHNDEQTAVYTINLAAMSKKALKEFLRRCNVTEPPLIQASSRLQDITAKRQSDEPTKDAESHPRICEFEATPLLPKKNSPIQSKITFEADDNVGELSDITSDGLRETEIKLERVDSENTDEILREPKSNEISEIDRPAEVGDSPIQSLYLEERSNSNTELKDVASRASNDIMDYPHFQINFTDSGAKEYICCINGKDNHFKTTLLISMKKHVQLKHSENWDGYCFVCKVIVTPQGAHIFKDCFQHHLDKHMDNFPVFQKKATPYCTTEKESDTQITPEENPSRKPFINVRPIYELVSTEPEDSVKESPSFPIIQDVVSLGSEHEVTPCHSSSKKDRVPPPPPEPVFKYEEVQAKVMSNKHCVVLDTMMARDKLIKIYKCAGRFCSFTSDSTDDALVHASTHQRIGGIDALNCSYCDFDAAGNAIDLVMHVFKVHGQCQYSCKHCFYRAAASQCVASHMQRKHGDDTDSITVLRTTTVPSIAVSEDQDQMMARDQAVQFYICNHLEEDLKPCNYRTYTADKYCDHVKKRHCDITLHTCYICLSDWPTVTEMVKHMESHGMKMYHCTYCIFGADSEAELLSHISSVHPTKQPQAYLRIITNAAGKGMRVLPLAFLNKKIKTEDVITPSTTKENPIREAERSIDLEKLIGLTMVVQQRAEQNEPTPIINEPSEDLISNSNNEPVVTVAPSSQLEAPSIAPLVQSVTITATRKSDVETVPQIADPPVVNVTLDPPPNVSQALPVKTEPLETPKVDIDNVVVLDSDEEESKQSVIDLSDEEDSTSTKNEKQNEELELNKKVPLDILSTCPKCGQVCKSMNGLKKHFYYCYPNKEHGCRCAHCPYLASSRDNIVLHYMDHCDRNIYQCGVCRINLSSVSLVKRHLRNVHKEKDLKVLSSVENGIFCYKVVASSPKRELPQQKLSITISNATETTPKRRFSPQEINQLPINPILDHLVYCDICEFSTKVRLNMVRHLQLHAEQQPVAQTAPVNPVPHLETNEKHFDKMLNLASSSIVNRPPEKTHEHRGHFVAVQMAPELAARYPKQISSRQRNTCGAVGCSYTSVDEPMLKRHWEALHSGPASFTFRCVHCPNNQITDTSKPITASRVVAHLKMHDDTLYACSKCNFYHFKRDFLEKHLTEVHPTGQLMVVRENASVAAAAVAAAPPTAAPTMDLKPWQCGFCKFKSMLRPEVVEHCFKFHQSKMQYRCGYCPYRASAVENVNNHLAHSHANEPEEVIHYYYREGSLADEADGIPLWMKQQQKMGSSITPEVKEEEPGSSTPAIPPAAPPSAIPAKIDLNLVKKEAEDKASSETEQSIEDLCAKFGPFCEPNGIKFKCPLCSVITEDTRDAMQSHLFEELKYRKWGCGLCTYKAFHKAGLTEHMTTEHRRQYDHIQLPTNCNIEKWVAGQLDFQSSIIEKHKANLAKQKIMTERSRPSPSVTAPPTVEAVEKYSAAQLEEAFGEFGAPNYMMYCCPKCGTLSKDEVSMRDHLEMELNKIRWGCTNCSEKYQTYHEAQFHCKGHDGPSRPKEAIRDPSMRAAWVTNIIQAQKKMLQGVPITSTVSDPPTPEKNITENDNSLLVVRYEERVPTPDQVTTRRKRPAPDSDDGLLVIDDNLAKKKKSRACSYCDFQCKYYNSWREHVLKHFNLKPYSCFYCDFSSTYRQGVITHTERTHPDQPQRLKVTTIPPDDPPPLITPKKRTPEDDGPKIICLFCEKTLPESEADTHFHNNMKPEFAKKGDVVVKCCICLVLRLDVKSLQDHHNLAHPDVPVNYALFKLHHDTRETHNCGHCDDIGFKYLRDLKTHHNAVHPLFPLKYKTVPYAHVDSNEQSRKKDHITQQTFKRCARKSTTKLPSGNSVAKKSTTKLPYSVPGTSEEGYSYYKTKPEPLEEYANVTTLMSFCNRMMPFTLKKLSEIINIEPKVIVNDIKSEKPQ